MRRRQPRRAFTLIEVLIATTGSLILVVAGLSLLTAIMGGTGDVLERAVGHTEPQELSEVLDPLLRRAGNGLPVDSTFSGLTVSGLGDTVYLVTARPTSGDPFEGTSCATSLAPTLTCARIMAPDSVFTSVDAADRYVVLTSAARRSVLATWATATVAAAGVQELQWNATATLGYPVPSFVSGAADMQVQRAEVTRVWYSAAAAQILVDDPAARRVGRSPWVLATDIVGFRATPLYNGRPAPGTGGLRPFTGTNPTFASLTGLQIAYTQRFFVLGGRATQSRTLVLSPPGISQ